MEMLSSSAEETDDRILITEWPVSPDQILSTVELKTDGKNTCASSHKCLGIAVHPGSADAENERLQSCTSSAFVSPPCKRKKLPEKEIEPIRNGGQGEPLAYVKVARWWRKNCQHINIKSLPVTNNPNTTLFHVSRTQQCIDFMQEEKRRLLRKVKYSPFQEKADIHVAIASLEEWLGNYASALESVLVAVQLDGTNSEYKWMKEKLQRQCRMMDAQKKKMKEAQNLPKVFPPFMEVERISAKNLSPEAFLEQFVQKKKPVILLDVVGEMTSSVWDFDFIQAKAGPERVTVKHAVQHSVEWAQLEDSRITSVTDFVDEVRNGQTADYLFDWSLPLHCPQLAKDLAIPKYFTGNFLTKTSPGSMYHDSWPSLFIAPKGVVSNLHVDAFASNFWMALFQGEKRWTFFSAEDSHLLYPHYIHSMDPVFDVDLTRPDLQKFPLLALTKPRQCVLKPGELLFVPAGSPHFVENLTNSLAVSSNHVDHSNYEEVCNELRINSLMDPRASQLLEQLESPLFLKRVKEK